MKNTSFSSSKLTLVACTAALLGLTQSHAANIATAGQTATGAADWRTASVVKPLDIDGDNIYGTDGYVMFSTSSAGQGFTQAYGTTPLTYNSGGLTTLSSTPSYISGFAMGPTANDVIGAAFYPALDNPAGGADIYSGFGGEMYGTSAATELNLLNITFGASAPATVRLGIYLSGDGFARPDSLRVWTDVGGTDNTGLIVPTIAAGASSYMFFDLTNISSGDVVRINGLAGSTSLGLNGVTFDAVPEPSAAALLMGILSLGWIGLRRRR